MNKFLFAPPLIFSLIPQIAFSEERNKTHQTISFSVEASHFEEAGSNEKGTQVFLPLQYTYSAERFDFGFKTAILKGKRDSSLAGGSGNVSTLSDTALSLTYRSFAGDVDWLGGRRATLAFNADINLPSGKNQLTGDEKNAVFDGFVVDHDRYGEGLNIGLGVSSTITLSEQTLLGFGLSYNKRGSYSPDGDTPNSELQPGNHKIASIQLLHTAPSYRWNLGYRLIDEAATKIDGVATYDRATSHEVFASGAFAINDTWLLSSSASFARRGADRLRDSTTGVLTPAAQDDTGDSTFVSLGISKKLSNGDNISLNASRRHRAPNDFDQSDFAFTPSLTRKEVSIGYDRNLSETTILNASFGVFEVEEGSILGFTGSKYNGKTIRLGVTHAF